MLAARAVLLPEALVSIEGLEFLFTRVPPSFYHHPVIKTRYVNAYFIKGIRCQAYGLLLRPVASLCRRTFTYLAPRDKAKVRDNNSLLLFAMITIRVLQCQRFFREPNAE